MYQIEKKLLFCQIFFNFLLTFEKKVLIIEREFFYGAIMKIDLEDILNQRLNEQQESAEAALNEYLENLKEIDVKKEEALQKALASDSKYKEKFTKSLMEMSLLISAAMVLEDDEDDAEFKRIQKKILFNSRQDDKPISDMRLFYLDSISPEEELNEILTEDSEKELFSKRIKGFKESYIEIKQI